jgi:hypothetical protein
MAINLVAEITMALEEYCDEVQKACDAAAKEAAELTVRQLKSSSPRKKGKGGGKYARGWRVKKTELGNLVSFTVHNGTSPGLTHVLEHGHVSRNQYGTYGRVRAIPHIGKAADAGIQRFELGVRARLRK